MTPSRSALAVLRLLSAGLSLTDPADGARAYAMYLPNGTRASEHTGRLIHAIAAAGWIRHDEARGRWFLTEAGRQRALVGHAVSDFVAALTQSPI